MAGHWQSVKLFVVVLVLMSFFSSTQAKKKKIKIKTPEWSFVGLGNRGYKGRDNNCNVIMNFDAVVTLPNNGTYLFKGKRYWRSLPGDIFNADVSSDHKVTFAMPAGTVNGTSFVLRDVDAAFVDPRDNKTIFIKDSLTWRVKDLMVDAGYPKNITEDWPGIPEDLDAVFQWSGDMDLIYFFKGSKYWAYSLSKDPHVDPKYPIPIEQLGSKFPTDIDAGFQHSNGWTYLFKADQYWRLSNKTFTIDGPLFPKPLTRRWFDCRSVYNMAASAAHSIAVLMAAVFTTTLLTHLCVCTCLL